MEKKLLILFLLGFNIFYGQSACDTANSDLIYAYSNIKSAYESNNIDHLKYYSNRSKESFERSQKHLKTCGCEKAYDLAYDAIQLLSKVANAETFEDGRFYVKRAKEIAQESITALDTYTAQESTYEASVDGETLSDLQVEQNKLKAQQEALKRKSEEIKAKLAEQNALALKLKKEEMVTSFKGVIASNLETYNNSLKACECHLNPIKETNASEDTALYEKSLEEIKRYYLEQIKSLTSNYLAQLGACN